MDPDYIIRNSRRCSFRTFEQFFGAAGDATINEIVRQAYVASRFPSVRQPEMLTRLLETNPKDVDTLTIQYCLIAWIISLDSRYLHKLSTWATSPAVRPLYRHDISDILRDLQTTYADVLSANAGTWYTAILDPVNTVINGLFY